MYGYNSPSCSPLAPDYEGTGTEEAPSRRRGFQAVRRACFRRASSIAGLAAVAPARAVRARPRAEIRAARR
jgi:hypothetical protein